MPKLFWGGCKGWIFRPSRGHFGGIAIPKVECVSPGMMMRDGGKLIAGTKDGVDLVQCHQKHVSLSGRFEPPHQFLALSGQPLGSFSSIVQSLMRAPIGVSAETDLQ
ncbi:MAG: hypothetical protein KDE03_07300 [Rhodobacteraceae bacterium]|nr:hypothetical protein [Paracoccaceae bacterium]